MRIDSIRVVVFGVVVYGKPAGLVGCENTAGLDGLGLSYIKKTTRVGVLWVGRMWEYCLVSGVGSYVKSRAS